MHTQYYGQKTLYDLTEYDGEVLSEYEKDVILAEIRSLREEVQDLTVFILGK